MTGSFLLGVVVGLPFTNTSKATVTRDMNTPIPMASITASRRFKLLFGTGFCGSFTTFSTYSVDVVQMMVNKKAGKALSYICLNNIGGFAAAYSGLSLVQRVCSL